MDFTDAASHLLHLEGYVFPQVCEHCDYYSIELYIVFWQTKTDTCLNILILHCIIKKFTSIMFIINAFFIKSIVKHHFLEIKMSDCIGIEQY